MCHELDVSRTLQIIYIQQLVYHLRAAERVGTFQCVTNYMRHQLCASRTLHIIYSSGTNCMQWSAGECVLASVTNYVYHELYTSRTLHIIYSSCTNCKLCRAQWCLS